MDDSKQPRFENPILIPIIVTIVYGSLNSASVFVPFIPGLETFLLFGIVFPLLATIWTLVWFAKRSQSYSYWVSASLLFSFLYVMMGVATLHIVGSIWAEV